MAAGILATGGIAMAPIPDPCSASVFLQEFERSGRTGHHVSVWERIFYSLMEVRESKRHEIETMPERIGLADDIWPPGIEAGRPNVSV